MPVSIEKRFLSASANGLPIQLTSLVSPGNLIHTAVAGTTSMDEIWLYVNNRSSGTNRTLTLQWGGTGTGQRITKVIAASQGALLIVPGWVLNNSLEVRAFQNVGSDLSIEGFVNRYTPA